MIETNLRIKIIFLVRIWNDDLLFFGKSQQIQFCSAWIAKSRPQPGIWQSPQSVSGSTASPGSGAVSWPPPQRLGQETCAEHRVR